MRPKGKVGYQAVQAVGFVCYMGAIGCNYMDDGTATVEAITREVRRLLEDILGPRSGRLNYRSVMRQAELITSKHDLLTFAQYTAAGEPFFELVRQRSERRQLREPQ